MAKRGYKLQEFVAHAGNVNCLTFGKKNCRTFITGGDDQKVNLWSVGKPTSLMSLCGHTSPVESAAFDSAEVLVVAGSSSGAIKLWDMEETKLVRTLTGHRSYCTAVEFHPFGEFFASGSMDTNLKIWDIRKKGCIHTYKGHTRGISTIRFSPDGRWVVSGGFDNTVKVWDLTAGKLLHDFKFHEGHVRSIEFHPLEFLLATGSADKTVKFWDLETFEMIGSARRETSGVRSVTFHPDGRNVFVGHDDSVKVYSWEPVICHDSVDMGWSTLGDLCIHDGKLLGGAYYENSVAIWVADVSLMEPYGSKLVPEKHILSETKGNNEGKLLEKQESLTKSKSIRRSTVPDTDSKEIKTIYVDQAGVTSITPEIVDPLPKAVPAPASKESSNGEIQKLGPEVNSEPINSVTSKTVDPPDAQMVALPSASKEVSTASTQKRSVSANLATKNSTRAGNKSLVMPNIVPRDGLEGKDVIGSRRDSLATPKASGGVSAKAHPRRLSSSPFEMGRMSTSLDSISMDNTRSPFRGRKDSSNRSQRVVEEKAKEPSEGKQASMKTALEKTDRPSSAESVSTTGSDRTQSSSKGVKPVRVVNGVAVVHGRTRSLVERFEKRDQPDDDKTSAPTRDSDVAVGLEESTPSHVHETESQTMASGATSDPVELSSSQVHETVAHAKASRTTAESSVGPRPTQLRETIRRARSSRTATESSVETPSIQIFESAPRYRSSRVTAESSVETPPTRIFESVPRPRSSRATAESSVETPSVQIFESAQRSRSSQRTSEPFMEKSPVQIFESVQRSRSSHMTSDPSMEKPPVHILEAVTRARVSPMTAEPLQMPFSQSDGQSVAMREEQSTGDENIIHTLLQNHDMLLSTFRSRLTKLQVVRHFWERNDIKGAITAVKRLPDHAVQADVVSVLIDKMETITMDLFSCLLPVLFGLLESKVERHSAVSLEILLKLVAVFGSIIRSTVSAPPAVGVDLHLEERRECCRECFTHLQNIQNVLPQLVRRGGIVARFAQQLNMVLQQP